jgi:hypothetical protein
MMLPWPYDRLWRPTAGLLRRHGPNEVARRNAAAALHVMSLRAEDRRSAEAAGSQVAAAQVGGA